LLNSKNELAVFFTLNGTLLGKLLVTSNKWFDTYKNFREADSNQAYGGSSLSNGAHSICFCVRQFRGRPCCQTIQIWHWQMPGLGIWIDFRKRIHQENMKKTHIYNLIIFFTFPTLFHLIFCLDIH
jgi:hypothetical protein